MPRKPLLVFLLVFSGLTLADALTTWWCIHQLGFAETNPLTDTTSLWTLLKPEIFALVVGAAMIWLGGTLLFRRTGWRGAETFSEFRGRLLTFRSLLPTLLLLVPLIFATGRLLPVLNNLAYMVFGDSGFSQLVEQVATTSGLTYYRSYAAAHVVLFVALIYPVTFLAHLWTRRGTW